MISIKCMLIFGARIHCVVETQFPTKVPWVANDGHDPHARYAPTSHPARVSKTDQIASTTKEKSCPNPTVPIVVAS